MAQNTTAFILVYTTTVQHKQFNDSLQFLFKKDNACPLVTIISTTIYEQWLQYRIFKTGSRDS